MGNRQGAAGSVQTGRHSRNPDFNGAQQEGCGYYQTTTNNKRRWSTAAAYLNPARQRPNLKIEDPRLCDEGADRKRPRRRCRVSNAAGPQTARARGEVIVSGGAFGSPHLLQLSGIGPARASAATWASTVRARTARRRVQPAGPLQYVLHVAHLAQPVAEFAAIQLHATGWSPARNTCCSATGR